jgi:hypothetical protein
MKRTVEVEVEKSDGSTILLGHTIAQAVLEDGKEMYVVGSGNTLAFVMEGVEYRANIAVLANVALKMHRNELLADDLPHNTQRRMFEAVEAHLKENPSDFSAIEMAVMTAIKETVHRDFYCDIHG